MSALYRTQAGDMIDAICWLYYGRSEATVERVLAANLGLCEAPLVLPAGLEIALPAIEPQAAQPAPADRPWD